MTVLMLTWEFYPLMVGGLGLACYELSRALLKRGVEILLVLPSTQNIWFHLKRPRDADTLPPSFLDPKDRQPFEAEVFSSSSKRLAYLGLSRHPDLYTRTMPENGEESGTPEVNAGYENLVAELAKRQRFDVIHAHDWMTFPAALRAKEQSGAPLVCHIHSTEYDRAGGTGSRRIHAIEAGGLAAADRVIAVSKKTAERLQRDYGI